MSVRICIHSGQLLTFDEWQTRVDCRALSAAVLWSDFARHRFDTCARQLKIKYDDIERRLAAGPTITMEGDANGAPHPEPDAYAKKFTGKYQHRTISGGIGHNLRQAAPQAFADAILQVDHP